MRVTTRGLKLFTGVMLVAGTLLLATWPWLLGPAPKKPTKAQVRVYGYRSVAYLSGLLVCVLSTGVGAILLVRRISEEFREESMENMKSLIEATLADSKKKQDASPEPD